MSRFSMLTAELGCLALDFANRAYLEGQTDEAVKFIQLAYLIFEQVSADAPACRPKAEGLAPTRLQ